MFVTKVLLVLFLCDFSFATKICYPVRKTGQRLRPRRFEICVELAWDEQRRIDVTCEFKRFANNSLCFFVEFERSEMLKGDRPLPTDCCSRPCKITEKIESVKNTSELLCVVRQYSGGRSRLFTTKRIDLDASSLDSIAEEETKPDPPAVVELIEHVGSLQDNIINVTCVSHKNYTKYIILIQTNGIDSKPLSGASGEVLNYTKPMQKEDNNTELLCLVNGDYRSARMKLIMSADNNDKINKDIAENLSRKTVPKNSEKLNSLSNMSVVIGGAVIAGIIIFIFSGVLFYYLNKKKLNGRTLRSGKNINEEITEELIYSYVSVDVLPFYEAKALAAANKKLGDRSFKPSLPDRPDATTESEYSYAQS